MLLIFLLFWVLLVWGLIDTEIYAKEAGIYAAIWVVSFLGFLFFPFQWGIFCSVGVGVILDVILMLKVLGGNPTIT